MKRLAIIIFIAALLVAAGCARRTEERSKGADAEDAASDSPKSVRVSAENADAAEPSVAAAPDGDTFVVWVEHGENKAADVMLARLDSSGQMKTPPVRVNPNAGEATAWRGDPPTVAVSPDGAAVHVGWTARVAAEGHASDLYLSTSRDGGKTFEPPVKVNDDREKVTHGMHSLAVGAEGRVYVVWLDERNVVMPAAGGSGKKMEHMEANREVFFASSADGGRSFSQNLRLAKDACPCCKTALTVGQDGRVFASWRQVLPGEFRHIALASSADGGKTFSQPVIVSDDRWMISSCPVSGPSLAAAADGALRVVWYTEGERGTPGLYFAESRDAGRTFSESKPFAKGEARGNPFLLADGRGGQMVVWESAASGAPQVMTARLVDAEAAAGSALARDGELPSAAVSGGQLFVGYITKINNRRSVWVIRAKTAA